jgi:hypothetical protein
METEGIFDLLGQPPFLQNDEFAARQFLYPVNVPEPAFPTMLLMGLGAMTGAVWLRGRRLMPIVRQRKPCGAEDQGAK